MGKCKKLSPRLSILVKINDDGESKLFAKVAIFHADSEEKPALTTSGSPI